MLISFPNMGPNWVAFKTLFTSLDLDVVVPDPTNREAIKIRIESFTEMIKRKKRMQAGKKKAKRSVQ